MTFIEALQVPEFWYGLGVVAVATMIGIAVIHTVVMAFWKR